MPNVFFSCLLEPFNFFLCSQYRKKTFFACWLLWASSQKPPLPQKQYQYSRNINTSIRKLTFLGLFENDLLLWIASQWSKASQNLKAYIWPGCQNNCQQVHMDSFTVTLLISRVCSQPKQTAGGSKVQEKCMGAKQLLNTSAVWASSLQNGNVLLLHYKNRPDYLFTWKMIMKRKKCWIDFSLLLFWPLGLGTNFFIFLNRITRTDSKIWRGFWPIKP